VSDTSDRLAQIVAGGNLTAPNLMEELDQGALVSDVVMLIKYVDKDGRVGLTAAWSEGLDWISRRGMIETFRDTERLPSDTTD
jgi:hypothetical protein